MDEACEHQKAVAESEADTIVAGTGEVRLKGES